MERKKTAFSKLFDIVDGIENVVLAIMVIGMVVTIMIQIIGRIIGHPSPWTEETSRYLFLWMMFVALAAGFNQAESSRVETVVAVEEPQSDITIQKEENDLDGLNYLAGKTVDFVNKSAMNGTILAHVEGGVPVLKVSIEKQNEFSLGQLFYFFEFACGISGYLMGVNPFNQPGVESYKSNMFALLGKPGYEEKHKELMEKL